MNIDFEKPMVLSTDDGHNVAFAMIDEIEHIYGELPTIHGHIISSGVESGKTRRHIDNIKKVVFNDPATIVMWSDGSKTVVKCQPGDKYSEELGLAMCIAKKYYGNTGAYNDIFKRFIPKESKKSEVIKSTDLGEIEFEITLDSDTVAKLKGLGEIKEG